MSDFGSGSEMSYTTNEGTKPLHHPFVITDQFAGFLPDHSLCNYSDDDVYIL